MKKLVFEYFYHIFHFHIHYVSNTFFIIGLLMDINVRKKEKFNIHKYYHLRLLAEYFEDYETYPRNFTNFQFYNSGYYYFRTFYCSLKNKNSLFFQVLCFFYSVIIEYYLFFAINAFFPYEWCPYLIEKTEQGEEKLNDKMQELTEKNFYYKH